MNRLFVVVAVMDGVEKDSELVKQLAAIDQGALPHWHGLRPDMHEAKPAKDDEEPHGKKIHVLFSKAKQGTALSRYDAVEFISLLSKKHELAGIKSQEEDLILLLIKAGSELTSNKWLAPVTSALIVPPPLLGVEDTSVALKIANAVSFGIEHDGVQVNKALSFDYAFQPQWIVPSAKDMALSDGNSFPTPALHGVATAMRLETYQHFPAQDLSLTDDWAANLDLSLNLWLCADGIDVLKDVTVKVSTTTSSSWLNEIFPLEQSGGMNVHDVARFAAAWMDIKYANRAFQAISKKHPELSSATWNTYLAHAKGREDFPPGLQNKCRSFDWYVMEVNTDLYVDDEVKDSALLKNNTTKIVKKAEIPNLVSTSQHEVKNPIIVPPAEKNVEVVQVAPEKKVNESKIKAEVPIPKAPEQVPKSAEMEGKKLPPPPGEDKKVIDAKDVRGDRKKPSKPLDSARLAIIQKAAQVDISFVDVSMGHADHPHKGARDENGKWGYVHDETALRKNPPIFQFPNLKDACDTRDDTYKMLTEQVFVDLKAHEEADKSGAKRDKIFCLVYTIESGHSRIPFIRETWG